MTGRIPYTAWLLLRRFSPFFTMYLSRKRKWLIFSVLLWKEQPLLALPQLLPFWSSLSYHHCFRVLRTMQAIKNRSFNYSATLVRFLASACTGSAGRTCTWALCVTCLDSSDFGAASSFITPIFRISLIRNSKMQQALKVIPWAILAVSYFLFSIWGW